MCMLRLGMGVTSLKGCYVSMGMLHLSRGGGVSTGMLQLPVTSQQGACYTGQSPAGTPERLSAVG
eukprot:4828649-Pyramimonas_sp.AAC.2